jgi:hypothetical protein
MEAKAADLMRTSIWPGTSDPLAGWGGQSASPDPEAQGTTVTGHRAIFTKREAIDPIHRCPPLVEAPTMTASTRSSSAARTISVNGSPDRSRNVTSSPRRGACALISDLLGDRVVHLDGRAGRGRHGRHQRIDLADEQADDV